MVSDPDAPVDLYVAAYADADAALKRLGRHQAARRR